MKLLIICTGVEVLVLAFLFVYAKPKAYKNRILSFLLSSYLFLLSGTLIGIGVILTKDEEAIVSTVGIWGLLIVLGMIGVTKRSKDYFNFNKICNDSITIKAGKFKIINKEYGFPSNNGISMQVHTYIVYENKEILLPFNEIPQQNQSFKVYVLNKDNTELTAQYIEYLEEDKNINKKFNLNVIIVKIAWFLLPIFIYNLLSKGPMGREPEFGEVLEYDLFRYSLLIAFFGSVKLILNNQSKAENSSLFIRVFSVFSNALYYFMLFGILLISLGNYFYR